MYLSGPSAPRMVTLEISKAPTKGAWPVRKASSPPPTVRATTMSASPDQRMRSGETTWTASVIRAPSRAGRLLQPPSLLARRVGAADVEERLLGEIVELALDEH